MRVVLFGSYGKVEIEARLREMEGVALTVANSREDVMDSLAGAEILLLPANAYDSDMAAAIRDRATGLRWIHLLTAGYEELVRHGVPQNVAVSNAGDAWSPAVAEHVMALLLAMVKGLPGVLANHTEHGWNREFSARMGSLDGMTLAIVGFGSIGRAVAQRARPFGVRVIGLSRGARPDPAADEIRPASSLYETLGEADAVLLAVPLSPETTGLMGRDAFAACKPGAILVNVARGGLINSPALIAALESGHLAGAALDVTEPEPPPSDDPLWDAPNLIISPHVAGASGARGRERLAAFVAGNVARFISDGTVTTPITGIPG